MRVKIDEYGFKPKKAHRTDAGYDLFATRNVMVPAIHDGVPGTAIIETGVHMEIPEGYCGIVISKSGLNFKSGILSTGLIDSGFSGEIKVKLYNHSDRTFDVRRGDKVSQLVICPIYGLDDELEEVDELYDTSRGNGGFGSTGR